MKPFLRELAEKIHGEHVRLEGLTIVFPNRRATLYFKKHLGEQLSKPAFSPRLTTIEDFISDLSSLKVPDKLELVHRLYRTYHDVVKVEETFDQFYFWGEMLLRDFDEVDRYVINASHIFKDLSHQKELDTSFDFLTGEQKKFLTDFWGNFNDHLTENKRKFLHVWKDLHKIYTAFREQLRKENLAYEGMLHRDVAEQLINGAVSVPFVKGNQPVLLFVGFNALTSAEEIIITHFINEGIATAYWDIDEYYVNSDSQEAGEFFRQYQEHRVLGKTFPHDIPANFRTKKELHVFGAAQHIGQSKLMAHVLQEELKNGASPEETVIVLADEKLLLPALHGVAGCTDKLNVTMGFPLSSTPLFNLIELLIEMQINCRQDQYNHRQVLALLGHPYGVAADAAGAQAKRKEILKQNWIYVDGSWLRSGPFLYAVIFCEVPPSGISDYLKGVVEAIGFLPNLPEFDREYVFHFVKFLNRMEEVLTPAGEMTANVTRKEAFKSFLRLFRQLVRSQKIPFSGEPLRGLQVMGVLETRNLDFKNVFILSLNEGAFPSFGNKGSYIPYNIRRAYKLPTAEHQDAIYAYLFYRILQRAENVFLFYNSETDVLGQGEMSRYLQQLLFESGLPIEKKVLHNPVQPNDIKPIVIKKDERVFNMLAQHCTGYQTPRELTPTALNDYIECRLKFYFKHVARIREAKEIEEELDARILGNFLHRVMEMFYQQIIAEKQSHNIEAEDFARYDNRIDPILDTIFIQAYGLDPTKKVVYEGQRLVVREVIKSFVDRIISIDKAYAPFRIEALESKGLTIRVPLKAEGNPVVVLGGIIDRVDVKDDLLRVIDYKTGKDKVEIKGNIPDLFVRDGDRNKAAFQTMLYALLYKSTSKTAGLRIVPGLINRVNLFDEDFKFGLKIGKDYVDDITPFLEEFETALRETLEELFNPSKTFDQTTNTEICRLCPYQGLCYR